MIVTETSYQPRMLDQPDDPKNSSWTLAIIEPDCDDQAFATYEEAAKVGTEYALTQPGDAMQRLVVVVETRTSIPIRW